MSEAFTLHEILADHRRFLGRLDALQKVKPARRQEMLHALRKEVEAIARDRTRLEYLLAKGYVVVKRDAGLGECAEVLRDRRAIDRLIEVEYDAVHTGIAGA